MNLNNFCIYSQLTQIIVIHFDSIVDIFKLTCRHIVCQNQRFHQILTFNVKKSFQIIQKRNKLSKVPEVFGTGTVSNQSICSFIIRLQIL